LTGSRREERQAARDRLDQREREAFGSAQQGPSALGAARPGRRRRDYRQGEARRSGSPVPPGAGRELVHGHGRRGIRADTSTLFSRTSGRTGPGVHRASGSSIEDISKKRGRQFLLCTAVALLVPFVVALVALKNPRWYPVLERAQTEIHVRDVGTSHTPLTGLIGRLGPVGQGGSHPGPLIFYALAPVYRLAGSSSWALQLSTVVLQLSAIGTALWLAHRRGGMRFLALMVVASTVLLRFYGVRQLTDPWNPYLPMLWWLVFVLSIWSVIDDDLILLPLAIVTGSLCVQTHISYFGPVVGLGGYAVITVLLRWYRRRSVPSVRRTGKVLGLCAALGTALWVPPIIEQLGRKPGNLSILMKSFTDSPQEPIGLRRGTQLILANLDPLRLLFSRADTGLTHVPSWSVASLLFLAAWFASVLVSRRLAQPSVLRLHVVLGLALVLGTLTASRIYGPMWAWLTKWVWGLTALLAVAIAWTLGYALLERFTAYYAEAPSPSVRSSSVSNRLEGSALTRAVRVSLPIMLAVIALTSAIALTGDASRAEPDDVANSHAVQHLAPASIRAISRRPASDRVGPYLVRWADSVGVIAAPIAYGLLDEFLRQGIRAGIDLEALNAAPYLTINPSQAAAVLTVVTGRGIAAWERKPGTHQVAYYDPRSRSGRVLQERLRRKLNAELLRIGLPQHIPQVNDRILDFLYFPDPRIPAPLLAEGGRILALGAPSAVFIEE